MVGRAMSRNTKEPEMHAGLLETAIWLVAGERSMCTSTERATAALPQL
jgi:hypothetical protein